jgi:hypothetical protein
VTYGGNKTHHSHPEVKDLADSKGLFFTGSKKDQRAVVLNMNGATSEHIRSALKIGKEVITPEEFKSHIKRVCRGNVPTHIKRKSFKSVVFPGASVYLQKLTKEEMKMVSLIIRRRGGLVTNRRTKNVQAVVINSNIITPEILDFWAFRGVQVFSVRQVKANS